MHYARRLLLASLLVLGVLSAIASDSHESSATVSVCTVLKPCQTIVSAEGPAITAVTPSVGPATTVTVTGNHLDEVTALFFGSAQATFTLKQFRATRTLPASEDLVATVPSGQPGSTVPVSAEAGTKPVLTTASYSYPLGLLDVTGPEPVCGSDPSANVQAPDWNYNGAYHTLNFGKMGPAIAYASSSATLNVTTEFDNDSATYPFEYSAVTNGSAPGVENVQCTTPFEIEGDGATYQGSLEVCELQPTGKGDGPCTNYDGNSGTWVAVETATDQLTSATQLSTTSSGPSFVDGNLAFPIKGLSILDYSTAETVRVEVSVEATDSHEGTPMELPSRYAQLYSSAFNVVVAPIAVFQADVIPYTIIYAPPGDQSTDTFGTGIGFGTDYTAGSSQTQTNSDTTDLSFQDQLTAALDTSTLTSALGGLGIKVNNTEVWDTTTKSTFGSTDDLSQESADTTAIGLTRTTSADWNDWPNNGVSCAALPTPASDGSLFNCGASGLSRQSPLTMYNHAAFWDDTYELVIHPQYAVYGIKNGETDTVFLAAEPTMGERTVRELYDCEEGVVVDGVSQCEIETSTTGLTTNKGGQVTYNSSSLPATITPDDAAHLLALDPFFAAGSQNAPLPVSRALAIGSRPYGAFASGAVYNKAGSSEDPNVVTVTFNNTQTSKNTSTQTYTSSLDVTNAQTTTLGVGVTLVGQSDTFSYTDKDSSGLTTAITYKDSTAVTQSQVTTVSATLSDIDPQTQGGKCPAATPTGPVCHPAWENESHVNVYLDRIFGSYMFDDPQAPSVPNLRQLASEPSQLAALTVEDAEDQSSKSSGFTDVARTAADSTAIGTVARVGLLGGVGNKFDPSAPLTGGELASSLGSAFGLSLSRSLGLFAGSQRNVSVSVSESQLVHALKVAFSMKTSVARSYVGKATSQGHYVASKVVTRGAAAVVLASVVVPRCVATCSLPK